MKKLIIIGGSAIVGLFLFWLLFLNHVSPNNIGVSYDSFNGNISKQAPGWHITAPWVKATSIDLLPIRYDINESSRALNIVRIARFKAEGLDEFIKLEGFQYFNHVNGFEYIFRAYVFSDKEWPFLEMIEK